MLLAIAVLGGCFPPGMHRVPPRRGPVRVEVAPRSGARSVGVLLRLDDDSVAWRPDRPDTARRRALRLAQVARVRIAEPMTGRDAFVRGAVRVGLVGATLGGVLLAIRRDAVGGAVGLTLGGAWLGGVFAAQRVESSDPPLRWRVVHLTR